MIGFYNYTMFLTYLSLISATGGIIIATQDSGHPYVGMFFLLISGLCDAFDGRVARTKKNRSDLEKRFGVQVDSLADLVAFGVLPCCIGNAMLRSNPKYMDRPFFLEKDGGLQWYSIVLGAITLLYVVAALVRLAYFNATEEERNEAAAKSGRAEFTGLPVTSAALVFPFILMLHYIFSMDFTVVYFSVMLLMAILFVSKFKLKKPTAKGVWIMVGIGLVEFVVLIIYFNLRKH